jgi:hypothetical protein
MGKGTPSDGIVRAGWPRYLFPFGNTLLACALLGAAGCKSKEAGAGQGLTNAPEGSATHDPGAGSSDAPGAQSAAAPAFPAGPPQRTPVAFARVDEDKSCEVRTRDLEPNLAFGGVGLATKGKEVALAWHYRTKNKGEGLLAFGGYDTRGGRVGQGHGLGKGALFPPQVFPRKDDWAVTWFDSQSLVFTRASWSPSPGAIGRLAAVTTEVADHTTIVPTAEGPLLAAAPLAGSTGAQLGLFLFAPAGDTPEMVKAISATHHASNPKHPAISEIGDGYVLVWEDAPAGKPTSIAITRFDASGKELDEQISLSTPGQAASRPAVVSVPTGAIVAWEEREGEASVVVVRAMDKGSHPIGPSYRVDAGSAPVLVAAKDGAVLAFLRKTKDLPTHVAAIHIGADGKPHASGVIVSELGKGKGQIAEAPAAASAEDGRLVFGYSYRDGMRSQMRTLVEGCLTGVAKPLRSWVASGVMGGWLRRAGALPLATPAGRCPCTPAKRKGARRPFSLGNLSSGLCAPCETDSPATRSMGAARSRMCPTACAPVAALQLHP